MAPLKVVCLISGGKDSLFSMLHCLENGHQIIALANLYPHETNSLPASEDLDSYMYQTIGHKILPLYEKALGLPLYRQSIIGGAVDQNKCYDHEHVSKGKEEDETEALLPLLQEVLRNHPDINAVSTGAILSDYQRTRVESVVVRSGLAPLSYLWQWPNIPPHTQTTLLEDMHAAGQDSRIIKVASGGLDSGFLWLNVANPRTTSRIDRAVKRFGSVDDGAVLGEGGEYETLAIGGPKPLWKGRLEVEDDQIKVVSGEAGSASVNIAGASVVEDTSDLPYLGVRKPPLFEYVFDTLRQKVLQDTTHTASSHTSSDKEPNLGQPRNTHANHTLVSALTGYGATASDQMIAIMTELAARDLDREDPFAFVDIAYISIVLRNMADFASVNQTYSASIRYANPPARVTIAEPAVLPADKDVMVSLTYVKTPRGTREGLHVQSQSYWAPANIGPYSQAISVPSFGSGSDEQEKVVYIAGQIPLIPASMELASAAAASGNLESFTMQAVLAAQHFIRIGRTMRVKQWSAGIAFVTAVSPQDESNKASIAQKVWSGIHGPETESPAETDDTESEDFDVWNARHGVQQTFSHRQDDSCFGVGKNKTQHSTVPPLHVIRVAALPRGASVEWATHGHTTLGPQPMVPHLEHLISLFELQLVG